jgi:hypothetical protein
MENKLITKTPLTKLAKVGMKKYGKEKMAKMAAKGRTKK